MNFWNEVAWRRRQRKNRQINRSVLPMETGIAIIKTCGGTRAWFPTDADVGELYDGDAVGRNVVSVVADCASEIDTAEVVEQLDVIEGTAEVEDVMIGDERAVVDVECTSIVSGTRVVINVESTSIVNGNVDVVSELPADPVPVIDASDDVALVLWSELVLLYETEVMILRVDPGGRDCSVAYPMMEIDGNVVPPRPVTSGSVVVVVIVIVAELDRRKEVSGVVARSDCGVAERLSNEEFAMTGFW